MTKQVGHAAHSVLWPGRMWCAVRTLPDAQSYKGAHGASSDKCYIDNSCITKKISPDGRNDIVTVWTFCEIVNIYEEFHKITFDRDYYS